MTLELVGVRKAFGDVQALDGVDLRVEPGQMMGFLGPNGAGKTTSMRAILGLNVVDEGALHWGGEPLGEEHRRRVGYMPQERGLYARMRVHEHISYIGQLAGLPDSEADARADRWIERVDLVDRRDDLVQELSVGNQQRVQLAVALVHEPRLLVLDEPFAGLDPVAVSTLASVMTEQVDAGAAVLFSSHQLDLVQDLCQHVTIINAGRTVATGTVEDLRAASHSRVLAVDWESAATWSPEGGEPIGPGRWVTDASADPAALMAGAASAGRITSFSFEPPGLDEVFLELVGAGATPAPASAVTA